MLSSRASNPRSKALKRRRAGERAFSILEAANATAMSANRTSHIRLTSHPGAGTPSRFPIRWNARTARDRGPVVATANAGSDRNAIGAHGGAYSIYRALAVSAGAMAAEMRPELTNTHPV